MRMERWRKRERGIEKKKSTLLFPLFSSIDMFDRCMKKNLRAKIMYSGVERERERETISQILIPFCPSWHIKWIILISPRGVFNMITHLIGEPGKETLWMEMKKKKKKIDSHWEVGKSKSISNIYFQWILLRILSAFTAPFYFLTVKRRFSTLWPREKKARLKNSSYTPCWWWILIF